MKILYRHKFQRVAIDNSLDVEVEEFKKIYKVVLQNHIKLLSVILLLHWITLYKRILR